MPKYWVKNYLAHESVPGEKKRETERWWKQWPSYAWRTQARMAHASRLGQYNGSLLFYSW